MTERPAARSRLDNSCRKVVLPAPDNPVIQKTRAGAPCSVLPWRSAWSFVFVFM
jgi:hypothetical protein